MCYNNCEYEQFNPRTQDCHCARGINPCPEEADPDEVEDDDED